MPRFRKDLIATKLHGSVRRRTNTDRRNSSLCPYCGGTWPDSPYGSVVSGQPVEVRAYQCKACKERWHEMRGVGGTMSGVLIKISKGLIT